MPQERFNRAGVGPQNVSAGRYTRFRKNSSFPIGRPKAVPLKSSYDVMMSRSVANPVGAEFAVKKREAFFESR